MFKNFFNHVALVRLELTLPLRNPLMRRAQLPHLFTALSRLLLCRPRTISTNHLVGLSETADFTLFSFLYVFKNSKAFCNSSTLFLLEGMLPFACLTVIGSDDDKFFSKNSKFLSSIKSLSLNNFATYGIGSYCPLSSCVFIWCARRDSNPRWCYSHV